MNISETKTWEDVRAAFKQIWGYEDFRQPQGEIVRRLLSGRDALIVIRRVGASRFAFNSQPYCNCKRE